MRASFLIPALFMAGGLVVASPCAAQVRITAMTPGGLLAWENPVTNCVHEVQRAEKPSGPWESFGFFTNRNWAILTNLPPGQTGSLFLRVAWVGGTRWEYRGYDRGGELVATGRVYMAFDKVPAVRGSWVMEAQGANRSHHAIGEGLLTGQLVNSELHLDFNPGMVDNNFLTQGPFAAGTEIYAGAWSFSGFAVLDYGTFRAEKMP